MAERHAPTSHAIPLRWKLLSIECVGLGLLVAGAVLLVVDSWGRGVPVLLLGAFMLLQPTQVVKLIERVFPPSG